MRGNVRQPPQALFCASAMAQNEARITTARLQRGLPEATMTLNVLCDGEPVYNLSNSQLTLTDNGKPVEDFSIIESSSPLVRQFISVGLVLDASGSMVGPGNAGTKVAGHAFVDFMDGIIDEATILFFNDQAQIFQQMTAIKPMLHSSIDALPAFGMTALWDAIIAGLNEVQSHGLNTKRALLVMTDGNDNSSTAQPSQIISLATQVGIRVFTVALGINLNTVELEAIAQQTGGQFFATPDPTQLQQIFTNIASFIGRGYDEHTISFRTPDPNAVSHQLQISVSTCNEVLPATRTVNNLNGLSVGDVAAALPFALRLEQNIPNPVATSTLIPFSLESTSSAQPVRLEVFDILGRKVATLFNETIAAGNYSVPFTPSTLAQGMYVIRLSSGPATQTRTMLLQR